MIWSEVFSKGVRPCAAGGATGGMSASLLSLHLVLRLKSIYFSLAKWTQHKTTTFLHRSYAIESALVARKLY